MWMQTLQHSVGAVTCYESDNLPDLRTLLTQSHMGTCSLLRTRFGPLSTSVWLFSSLSTIWLL